MTNFKLIFDAHIHLNDPFYQEEGYEISELLKEASQVGVGYFLNASFDLESSRKSIAQAQEFNQVYAAVGIHPMDVHHFQKTDLKIIDQLAKAKKVVAIGEVGLDYYWKKDNHEEQQQWLINQIKIAKKHDLTLMLHIRDEKNQFEAYDDALKIISEHPVKKMIVHCFSANAEYAQKFLDLGCYINIGGAVTFKNARDLQEAAKMIPLNRLLVETDAPYLSPHPFRGQKNFPKMIVYTVKKLAELKELRENEIIEITTKNAFEIFAIEELK